MSDAPNEPPSERVEVDDEKRRSDEAPKDLAKEDLGANAVEVYRPVPKSVGGMIELADATALSVSLEELASSTVAQKMVLTRAIGLEAECTELRESNGVLSGQVSTLRQRVARIESELSLVRTDLRIEKQAKRLREVIGGIGLSAFSAGLGLMFAAPLVGSVVAGIGALVTLAAYFLTRGKAGGTS